MIDVMAESQATQVDVSVIMTVHNAAEWIGEAVHSVLSQTFSGKMELSVFNDCSTDKSMDIIDQLSSAFKEKGIKITFGSHDGSEPGGVGYGSNRAIQQSSGKYICILDADDVMTADRIDMQYAAAQHRPNTIIGCGFTRTPDGSTERYTRWCNTLTLSQLYTQAFTAFGPTVVKPTWFLHRDVYNRVGPFSEDGTGTPEDLIFFYKHLSLGGKLIRVDPPLVIYRQTIWDLRVKAVQEFVISKWSNFTIWNAGKQGRRLFRSLTRENQAKVVEFCDVDSKKIALGHYTYEQSTDIPKPRIPIVHYKAAKPPFLLCVKWDLTEGEFERNLESLGLKEGEDYYHFS